MKSFAWGFAAGAAAVAVCVAVVSLGARDTERAYQYTRERAYGETNENLRDRTALDDLDRIPGIRRGIEDGAAQLERRIDELFRERYRGVGGGD